MLKRIVALTLTCLFAAIAFAGCSTNSEQNECALIEEALQERYGEEFVCKKTWNNEADGYYSHSFYGLCHPKDDESLLFETLLKGDGTILGDDYASTIISRRFSKIFDEQIGTRLGKHYTYCYNFGDLDDDATGQIIANNEFTLDYYFSQYHATRERNRLCLYYTILIDSTEQNKITYEEEYDLIVSALENIYAIGKNYDMDLQLLVDLFFLTDDTYNNCVNYLNVNAQLNPDFYDLIDGYLRYPVTKKVILLNREDNIYSLTKNDYIIKREELLENV